MKKEIAIERYLPTANEGLTSSQIQSRKEMNLVNNTKQKTSKTYLKIFTSNIFTFFNMLWAIIFIALIAVESYSNLLFMIVIIFNTVIEIFLEIIIK